MTAEPCNLIFQYDQMDNLWSRFKGDLELFDRHGFEYFDRLQAIDTVLWDCAYGSYAFYPSEVMPPCPYSLFGEWLERGFDFPAYLVERSRRRELRCLWNFRMSEVDRFEPAGTRHPMADAHTGWTLKTWWPKGLWNYADASLRTWRVDCLMELAERYDFDGFQIDFARHLPLLPVGRQRELASCLTDFMRRVRSGLEAVGRRRGRGFLLAARVNRSPSEALEDGLDVKAWTDAGLVDLLVLGTRSFEVEVEAWRKLAGPRIGLYPSIDQVHHSDGYGSPPATLLRGVAERFRWQGADGLSLFNWYGIFPDSYRVLGYAEDSREVVRSAAEVEVLPQIVDRAKLLGRDKVIPVERRGGYDFREGNFNGNLCAQLPAAIPYDGDLEIAFKLSDDFQNLRRVDLSLTLSNAMEGDRMAAAWNGEVLPEASHDYAWSDDSISSLTPGVALGHAANGARLAKLEFRDVSPSLLKAGKNSLRLREVSRKTASCCRQLYLEKAELSLFY